MLVTEKSTGFDLPPLSIAKMEVLLVGDTPLIMHKWSEKAKKEMLDKQMKKAKLARKQKTPSGILRKASIATSRVAHVFR